MHNDIANRVEMGSAIFVWQDKQNILIRHRLYQSMVGTELDSVWKT